MISELLNKAYLTTFLLRTEYAINLMQLLIGSSEFNENLPAQLNQVGLTCEPSIKISKHLIR